MVNTFVELIDELYQNKARLNFLIKAFVALAAESSGDEVWSKSWEAHQTTLIVQEILNRIVERTKETLDQHLSDTLPD